MAENNYTSFNNSNDMTSESIDFGRLIRHILMQSKLILSITFASFALSTLFYFMSPKQYQISSLLQVESFNQNIFDPTNTLQMMSPSSSASDINNLVLLYESRTNLLKLIKDLKLNIKIEGLKKDESIDIDLFTDQSDVPFSDEFAISFNNGLIEIYNSNNEIVSKVKVNEEASIDLERTYAIKFNKVNLKNNRKLKITYKNPINLHKQLKNQLKVTTSTSRNSFFRQQGLIEINYITDDIDTGKDIINYANDIFLNQNYL